MYIFSTSKHFSLFHQCVVYHRRWLPCFSKPRGCLFFFPFKLSYYCYCILVYISRDMSNKSCLAHSNSVNHLSFYSWLSSGFLHSFSCQPTGLSAFSILLRDHIALASTVCCVGLRLINIYVSHLHIMVSTEHCH